MTKTITQKLKDAFDDRQEKDGLTYQEFADLVGLDKASAFRKINGATGIDSGEELDRFAKALKVKIDVKGPS